VHLFVNKKILQFLNADVKETLGSYNESKFKPPFPYKYLYCGSSLYGNISASRIREWMAYHMHFFHPRSNFVLHDAGGFTPAGQVALDPLDMNWMGHTAIYKRSSGGVRWILLQPIPCGQ
jgi:hypothetical protein